MKKLTSLILTVCMLAALFAPFSVLPVGAEGESASTAGVPETFASESTSQETYSTTGNVTDTSEDDYVYYSDLFYGYPGALYNDYLYNYYSETSGPNGILTQVEDDYRNSPMFLWTDIKASLAAATDLKEWTKIIADRTGLTKFTYNDALDKANEAFAQEIYGTPALAKYYGNNAKWMKNFNKVLKVFDTFEQNFEVYELTEEEIYVEMLQIVKDENVFSYIGVSQIQMFEQKLLTDIHGVTKLLSKGADAMTAAKTVVIGLMMEDFRLEILDDILASCEKGTTLYDGMTRLKNQLRNGFATYFWDNYITTEFMDKIADEILKYFTADTLLGSGSYKVITAIINLGSWVVFDVLFNVPDIDDLTTQMVLSDYSRNLYSAILIQSDVFLKQFKTTAVKKFESLFSAYIAATSAALKASDKIKLSGNKAKLSEITSKYTEVDVYEVYVETAKAKVASGNSPRIDFGTWTLSSDTTMSLGSDSIEGGYLYCVKGVFVGNIVSTRYTLKSKGDLTIPNGYTIVIDGNVYASCGYIDINNYGDLTIKGDLECRGLSSDLKYGINNYGDLTIKGDLTFALLTQSSDDAILRVGGNYSCVGYSRISAGTIIFDGTEQQTVDSLRAKNIEVTNPAGIKYLSGVCLSGEYKLNGNPLDNNGYLTHISDGASFADNSDYKSLCLVEDVVLTTSVKGNFSLDCGLVRLDEYGKMVVQGFALTIPEGYRIVIDGNVTSGSDEGHINNYGDLTIKGDLVGRERFNSKCGINNYGDLTIKGDLMLSRCTVLVQSSDDAILRVGGNYSCVGYSRISAGTIIFDGTKQQTVYYLKAPTIVLENSSAEGVFFAHAISPAVLFNHKGNNFTLYENNDSTFVDYDNDGMKDNVDPDPIIPQPASITKQPVNTIVAKGKTAGITLEAVGAGLTYKWYYKDKGMSSFKLTTSFKGASYSVAMSAARSGRQVYCVITDKFGNTVTTKTVTLSMKARIATQPKSVQVAKGKTAKVTVKAEGEGLTYKWYYKDKGMSSFKLTTSFKGASYSVQMTAARSGRQVYCVVTDEFGNKVTSKVVTLAQKARIATQPKSVTVAKNKAAKITVKAEGEGLKYTWYVKKAGATKFSKSSVKTSSYSVKMTSSAANRQVYCKVTDKFGNTVTTKTVSMKIK